MVATPDNDSNSATSILDRPAKERVRWIDLGGKEVLFLDFSHAPAQESLQLIDDFREALKGKGPASVLMLTDVTGSQYDPAIASKWKAARSEEDAKIKASAVYGLKGLVGIAVYGFIEAARILGLRAQNIKVCLSGDDARAWLTQRP